MPIWVLITLVLTGIGVGVAEPGRFSYAFGAATLYVFLPPLLFEAAWNLDFHVMRAWWRPIFVLSVPGVLLTTVVVASGVALVGMPWPGALIIGAAVSATDPIAVVAIFRRMPVPLALSTIVQSEALLNDAMAVAVYRAALVIALTTVSAQSIVPVAALAILSIAVGIAVGVGLALFIGTTFIRRRGTVVQVLATLAGTYAAYFACEVLHASGIFAVIAFGIALRELERHWLSVAVAQEVERVWDVFALFANAAVFFLTGAALEISRIATSPVFEIAALAAVLLARLLLAYILTPLALGRATDARWLHVVRAAAVRGALSLALVIALPADIAGRSTVITVTFTIVLATLLGSALTVPRAVRAAAVTAPP